jgi:ADP-ribosylglycohydrolase
MISAAFATKEVDQIVLAGLSEIPERSRLAEAVRDVLKWARQYPTWEEAWEKVMSKYGSYSWIHTINNAAIVVLGLAYGERNFEESIAVSVMSGLDTDCDGATCGSILGTILGSSKLPPKWIDPLSDRLKTAVFGFLNCRISNLAKRTFLAAKKLKREAEVRDRR